MRAVCAHYGYDVFSGCGRLLQAFIRLPTGLFCEDFSKEVYIKYARIQKQQKGSESERLLTENFRGAERAFM